MKLKAISLWGVLLCIVLLSASGCRRSLHEKESKVQSVKFWVEPDWLAYNPSETMRAIFYPEDPAQGTSLVDVLINPKGDSVALIPGAYRMVLFNTDVQNILFEATGDRDRVSARVFDPIGPIYPSSRAAGQAIPAPDMLYAGSNEIKVIQASERAVASMKLVSITVNVRVQVAQNDQVQAVSSLLRNVADGVWLARQEPFFSSAQGAYTTQMAYLDQQGAYYNFTSRTFGASVLSPEHPVPPNVYLDIQITYTDGTSRSLSVDITEPLKRVQETVEAEVSINLTEVGGTALMEDWRVGPFATEEID